MKSGRKLLLLGGNRYNVPAIRAARAAGFVTLVADRNPQAPGLSAADVGIAIDLFDYASLLEAVQQYGGVDGIVSMAEVGVRPAADLSYRLGLPSISQEAAANATSKAAMRRQWSKIGKYSTDFCVVSTEEEAFHAIERLATFPMIFKPDRSFGGARGVIRVEAKDEVRDAFLFARSGSLPNSDIVIEPFVHGTEHSAEVLIWEGQTSVLCVGEKVKSSSPYRVDVSVQYPARLSSTQETAVADMCDQAVAALGLKQGMAHIEFAYTPNGPVLFELGARCGGGHTPQIAHHVSGVNEFVEACRMACGIPPTQFLASASNGADYRFLIFPPGKLKGATVPDDVRCHKGIADVAVTLEPGDEVRPLRTTSQRAGFIVTLGRNRQEAIGLADWACRQISVTYDGGAVAHAYTLSQFEEPYR